MTYQEAVKLARYIDQYTESKEAIPFKVWDGWRVQATLIDPTDEAYKRSYVFASRIGFDNYLRGWE